MNLFRSFLAKTALAVLALAGFVASCPATGQSLRDQFVTPPPSARPWVYWFWLNGNITREGITADLEAMARVGIGGVLIMEVDQGAPLGPVPFASPAWRELFQHVCKEADRLGLEVNMNNDAGWNGSGGPWITPEVAMQKLVWSETPCVGGKEVQLALQQPPTVGGFYRDVAVMAIPKTGPFRIPDLDGRSALVRQEFALTNQHPEAPAGSVVSKSRVIDLTSRMDEKGKLLWDAPVGEWTVLRFGHTLTGMVNIPAPASGTGLECDKLSKAGAEAAFQGLMGKLIADNNKLAGKTLVATHIDSWENHSQNWTPKFRQEFRRLRGYDPLPFLPAMAGIVVQSREVSERFLFDVRQTVSDLIRENYSGHFRTLAKRNGLRLTIEAYGDCVFDDLAYAGTADEPMTEFWSWPNNFTAHAVHTMGSAARVYGKQILGAEAFTATDGERWQHHPATIKVLNDWAFCRGVNRMVYHRYALQPWLNVAPGMSMGPWGLHYERTQTWWELTKPWHTYQARCQAILQQGTPIVDLLFVQPEGAPRAFIPPVPGDACPAEVVIRDLEAKAGILVLPHGMAYHALVLPDSDAMTPELLKKVQKLAEHGARIYGKRPAASPSLSGYPNCDETVRNLVKRLWDNGLVQEHYNLSNLLPIKPDFESDSGLDYIHKMIGRMHVYFVANPNGRPVRAKAWFRVSDKQPEFWDPETGTIRTVASYVTNKGRTQLDLFLEAGQSCFVVFDKPAVQPVPFVTPDKKVERVVPKVDLALWGPPGDAVRTVDVTQAVQRILESGRESFVVAELVSEGDPALNVLKTLTVDYSLGDKRLRAQATDPERIVFDWPGDPKPSATLERTEKGFRMEVRRPGRFEVDGKDFDVPAWDSELALPDVWELRFPHNGPVRLNALKSWTDLPDSEDRFFSGTATYTLTFEVGNGWVGPEQRTYLDLGKVEVIAEATLNGRPLGISWRAPHVLEATKALRVGTNHLEVKVTNLWINRMIGDEELQPETERQPNGTLSKWPDWVLKGQPNPTGRKAFSSWNLWRKGEPLRPSGLLGPVRLTSTKVVDIPSANN